MIPRLTHGLTIDICLTTASIALNLNISFNKSTMTIKQIYD